VRSLRHFPFAIGRSTLCSRNSSGPLASPLRNYTISSPPDKLDTRREPGGSRRRALLWRVQFALKQASKALDFMGSSYAARVLST